VPVWRTIYVPALGVVVDLCRGGSGPRRLLIRYHENMHHRFWSCCWALALTVGLVAAVLYTPRFVVPSASLLADAGDSADFEEWPLASVGTALASSSPPKVIKYTRASAPTPLVHQAPAGPSSVLARSRQEHADVFALTCIPLRC
jgi:hypothetical protein